jgi:hypothetical protein
MLATVLAAFLVLAAADTQSTTACHLAMRDYDSGVAETTILQQVLARLDGDEVATPAGRIEALALFERQESVAKQLRAVVGAMRQTCRDVSGFDQVDAELRKFEPLLRTLETDSRQMRILLSGGRQA